MRAKTKEPPGGNLGGSKTIQKLRREYHCLSLLQAPVAWLFWTIQGRLDRLETERLRLTSRCEAGGRDNCTLEQVQGIFGERKIITLAQIEAIKAGGVWLL
jgi:hypothetical protein